MGDVYSVTARLVFPHDDPSKWCEVIAKEIEEYSKSGKAKFRKYRKKDLKDPWGCFNILTANSAQKDEGLGQWYADFDASYGWGTVIADIFEKAAIYMGNNSFINVEPWSSDPVYIHARTLGTIVYKNGEDIYYPYKCTNELKFLEIFGITPDKVTPDFWEKMYEEI